MSSYDEIMAKISATMRNRIAAQILQTAAELSLANAENNVVQARYRTDDAQRCQAKALWALEDYLRETGGSTP